MDLHCSHMYIYKNVCRHIKTNAFTIQLQLPMGMGMRTYGLPFCVSALHSQYVTNVDVLKISCKRISRLITN